MSRIHFNNLKHFQKTGPFDPLHQINGRNEIWGISAESLELQLTLVDESCVTLCAWHSDLVSWHEAVLQLENPRVSLVLGAFIPNWAPVYDIEKLVNIPPTTMIYDTYNRSWWGI